MNRHCSTAADAGEQLIMTGNRTQAKRFIVRSWESAIGKVSGSPNRHPSVKLATGQGRLRLKQSFTCRTL
jgi:hypothetical protein